MVTSQLNSMGRLRQAFSLLLFFNWLFVALIIGDKNQNLKPVSSDGKVNGRINLLDKINDAVSTGGRNCRKTVIST
jgi:hypothetical protein